MKKLYRITGTQPFRVTGFGRVNPGTNKTMVIDFADAGEEAFMLQIGAVQIVKEMPEETPLSKPGKVQGQKSMPVIEFDEDGNKVIDGLKVG